MAANWERYLERWVNAGLIDAGTAASIRTYETAKVKAQRLGWPVLFAISLGGVLLAAGILLLVAAHWDKLSPAARFTLVLALVALMHVAGAIVSTRFTILSTVLHAVGTICLGAGIFLAGQIFHLQEHWPLGVMLWASGAWVAWAILHDWPQAALAAVLTPAWLAGEWTEATRGLAGGETILAAGLLSLAITYLTALLPGRRTSVSIALAWIGGLTLIPAVAAVIQSWIFAGGFGRLLPLPWSYHLVGWAAAFLLPVTLAWRLRGKYVWWNVIAALWVGALSATSLRSHPYSSPSAYSLNQLLQYVICALGSVGLIAWGLKEARKERVNLGIVGFALTVLFFYFSTVMDKLGRSASLIGMGLLFLLGGWLLEKTRRRLLLRIEKGKE